jgi:hypothetical protein
MKSGSRWRWLESLLSEGSEVVRWDDEMCVTGQSLRPRLWLLLLKFLPIGDPQFNAGICFEEGFDVHEILPEDRRLANLYERDLVGDTRLLAQSSMLTISRSAMTVSSRYSITV